MWIRLTAACAALMMLSGCWEKPGADQNSLLIEQERQIESLRRQVAALERTFEEVSADGMIVRYQTVTRTATFKGGGDTLDRVRDRKRLLCGGNADLPGFGFLDPDSSEFTGFDIDFCRAVGAAVLGTEGADLVDVVPLTSKLRFVALQTGEIDLLSRNTTWTYSRDTELRLNFPGVSFYDGQGMLVRTSAGIKKLSDLSGKAVCVQGDSTSDRNIRAYFESRDLDVEIRAFDERNTARDQYERGACEGFTGDKSSLISQLTLLEESAKHQILIEEISREPLGPVVRDGDANWDDIVHWTLQCMITAEALDISQSTVDKALASPQNAVRALLGVEGELGPKLGLSRDFCYQVIRQVGSYRDVYLRHLGNESTFRLPRGLNALYSDGGLHYPLPFN